jgi:hypothetical protein
MRAEFEITTAIGKRKKQIIRPDLAEWMPLAKGGMENTTEFGRNLSLLDTKQAA